MILLKKQISKGFKILLIAGFLYFFWLMLKITSEYIPAQKSVAFLMIKQTEVVTRPEYLYLFYTHVYTAIFVLLTGFLSVLRKDFGIKNFHKNAGKVYIFLILFFAAPSGIYMGIFANGGIWSKTAFIILGVLWWIFTFKAYQLARAGKYREHKRWMWRSFALTVSAITLRMWKVIIVYLFHPNPMDVYQIIAWLGWLPNLLLIEYLIKKQHL